MSAAAAVLRKAGRLGPDAPDSDAWDRLARTTIEGVVVPPLGTAARAAGAPPPGEPGLPPYTRGSQIPTGEGWDVRALVAEEDPAVGKCRDPGRSGGWRHIDLGHPRRIRDVP